MNVPIFTLDYIYFYETMFQELQKWLDESNHGCIYVSFGSMVKIESFPKEVLDAFYDTFRHISPVRVLMKIANKQELPSGLPKNVKTYHWLPQVDVLSKHHVPFLHLLTIKTIN